MPTVRWTDCSTATTSPSSSTGASTGGSSARSRSQSYYNYIDHVMDNFTLRTPGTSFSVSNPDRATAGGRVAVTLAPLGRTMIVLGGDVQHNVHTSPRRDGALVRGRGDVRARDSSRASRTCASPRPACLPRPPRPSRSRSRLVGGFRNDWHSAAGQPRVRRGLHVPRRLARSRTTPLAPPTARRSRAGLAATSTTSMPEASPAASPLGVGHT